MMIVFVIAMVMMMEKEELLEHPSVFEVTSAPTTGCGRRGYKDGPAATAEFNNPVGSCCCPDGTVFIAGA